MKPKAASHEEEVEVTALFRFVCDPTRTDDIFVFEEELNDHFSDNLTVHRNHMLLRLLKIVSFVCLFVAFFMSYFSIRGRRSSQVCSQYQISNIKSFLEELKLLEFQEQDHASATDRR